VLGGRQGGGGRFQPAGGVTGGDGRVFEDGFGAVRGPARAFRVVAGVGGGGRGADQAHPGGAQHGQQR